MINQKYYYSKEELYKTKPSNCNIIISVDKDENKGNKYFMAFESSNKLLNFLEGTKGNNPNFYEVIPDMNNYSTWVFLDIDRELTETDQGIISNYDEYLEKLLIVFKKVFERFIKDMYKKEIELIEGKNWQISYTPKSNKISCHIKINIKCPNLKILKMFIINLERYITSNRYITEDEREYFYFYKIKNGVKKYTSIIDSSIYSNFRSMRILYSSKLKRDASASIPYKESSKLIKDHLVIFYSDIVQDIIEIDILKNIDNDFEVDYSKKNNTHIVITNEINKKSVLDSDITPEYKTEDLNKIKDIIIKTKEIQKIFGVIELNDPIFLTTTICRFTIKKNCECICAYAKRVHKNNNSQFDYYYKTNIIKYTCFDEECQNINCLIFKFTPEIDSLIRFNELNNTGTLHCKEPIISWDDVYESEGMMNYPLKPLVCIRGGMGSGKTITLINEFIVQNCLLKETKCLFITYQILLSKKYTQALKVHNFQNYLDCNKDEEGYILDRKVIICLDSLWRIKTGNFDYIFMDEALSVLLHFNSPLMKNVNIISSIFELLFLQAKHIYLLDACIDNQLVVNFVNYISNKRNIAAYWIINRYIRLTNRKCIVYINNEKKNEKNIKTVAIEKIIKLLDNNKKIVVSSSTKTFTDNLEMVLIEKYGNTKKIIIYNSSTDKVLMNEHAENPNNIWINYDILIYSPTIGAGLSFEKIHFDVMVCFIENSFYTPTVDFTLQQMFRVRQLKEGKMFLYINDLASIEPTNYPILENEVSMWLDKNTRTIQNYFPNIMESSIILDKDNSLIYDKDRLSYHILNGIIYNKNKSIRYFTNILLNTLQKDYNIPCKKVIFASNEDILLKSFELYEEIKKQKKGKEIVFDKSCIINGYEYEELARKQQRNESLTNKEILQKWIYHVAIELWGINNINNIDKEFFDEYIGNYECKNINKAYDKYYQIMRTRDLLNNTIEENKRLLELKIESILSNKDYNLELYKTKTINYYKKLIEGQKILNIILNEEEIKKVKTDNEIILESKDMENKIKNYLENLTRSKYNEIIEIFSIKKSYGVQKDTIESTKKQYEFVKQIMNIGFDINVGTKSRGSKQIRDIKIRNIDIKNYKELLEKYKPVTFTIKMNNYNIMEEYF